MNLKTFKKFFIKSISHAQHTLFISTECPFHTLVLTVVIFSSIHHYIIFYGYKGQLVNQSVIFTNFKKS